MNTTSVVLIVLLALVIGASIPVLIQFRATLREMERRLQGLGDRLEIILRDSQVVTSRLARVSGGLEGGEDTIRELMEAIGQLSKVTTRSAGWMGLATSLGAVVGPTVAAAVHAYRSAPAVPEEEAQHQPETSRQTSRVSPPAGGDGWEAIPGHSGRDESSYGGLVDAEKNQQRQQRGAGYER